eukprot:10082942-Karenia_brevis.AAC.1
MGPMIQDLKAHALTSNLKGSGGWKCCQYCKNVMNCDPDMVAHSDYLVHYSVGKPHEFDRFSAQELWEMADNLQVDANRYAAGTLGKTQFKRLEKQYGLVYEKEGL